jgi:hypothetical protein
MRVQPLSLHFRVAFLCGVFALIGLKAEAQTPLVLPYTINPVAGGGTVCAAAADAFGDGCPAQQATLNTTLLGLAVDPQGDIIIDDTVNNLIRRVDAHTGIITVLAGSTSSVVCAAALDKYGDGCPASDGLANAKGGYTNLDKPFALTVARNGDVYFTGTGSMVQKVSAATGVMSLVAGYVTPAGAKGASVSGYTGDGGPATVAEVNAPRGVSVSAANDVYIADYTNNVVRVVYGGGATAAVQIVAANPTLTPVVGDIYTICGSHTGIAGTTGNLGTASAALLTTPSDVAVDPYGNVYILDQNKEVRMIYAGGTVMGIASPVIGDIYLVAGGGTVKGNTLAAVLGTNVTMSNPRRIVLDARGDLYVTDSNGIIWFEDLTTGWMRPIAGVYKGSTLPTGCPQQTDSIGDNCPATVAQFLLPTTPVAIQGYGIAVDSAGNLYVADASAETIRKVSTDLLFPSTSTAETQTLEMHYAVGTGPLTVVSRNPDYVAGTTTCIKNGDNTQDCTLPITLTPTTPGVDDSTLITTDTLANKGNSGLAGVASCPHLRLIREWRQLLPQD